MPAGRVYGQLLYPTAAPRAGSTVRFILDTGIDYEEAVIPGFITDARSDSDGNIDVELAPGDYIVQLPDGSKFPEIEIESGSEELLADLLFPT